jgi:nicotinic acid mononucleotide adenylyltransferase
LTQPDIHLTLSPDELAAAIHATPTRLVLAITGGGSRAISGLLEVPGASRTLLEAIVPYSEGSLIRWLGGRPDQACSPPTARAMAMAAFCRACDYQPPPGVSAGANECGIANCGGDVSPSDVVSPGGHAGMSDIPLAGIAATASLASDRPKRGPHRVYLAAQTATATLTWSLELAKGRRSRVEEEQLVSRLVLNLTAEVCGLSSRLELNLLPEEHLESLATPAPRGWQELLQGARTTVRHGGGPEPSSRASDLIFPGAFHPLHAGHRRMAQLAEALLGRCVEFEISIRNVDKPPLDYSEIQQRLSQFGPDQTVWLTRAATFEEKSREFPGATFVVGADTIRRIADARYYGGQPAMREALQQIASRGCRFLVFGRLGPGGFVRLGDLDLPPALRQISIAVSAEQFREDISSTELRRDADRDRE